MPFRILDARSKPLAIANNRFPTRREAQQAAAHLRIAAGYEGLRVKRDDGAGFKRNGAASHPPPPLSLWRARGARSLGATWTHPEAGWTATLTPMRTGGGWRVTVASPGRRSKKLFEEEAGGHPENAYAMLLGWVGVGDYPEVARRTVGSTAMRKFLRGQPLTAADALGFWGARSAADAGRAADATEAALHAALFAYEGATPGALPPLSHLYGAANLSRLLRGRHGAEVGLPPPPDPPPRFGHGRRVNGAAAAWAPIVGERVSGHDNPRLGRSWRRGVVSVGEAYVDVEGDPLDPGAPPVRVPRGGFHRSERKMNRAAESVTEFEPPRPGAAYHAVDAGGGRVLVRDARNAVAAVGTFPPGTERARARWLARWGASP